MVDRCSLFPDPRDCPTYNTHACQSVVHLVPGLAEHFVNLDDDCMIIKTVRPSDFFTSNGEPLIFASGTERLVPVHQRIHAGPNLPPKKMPVRLNWCCRHLPIPMLK